MFLNVGIDARDGDADPAITLRHTAAKNYRYQDYQRHGGQHDGGEQRAEAEHDRHNESQHQHVAQDGDQPRSEQVVEHIHVGGYPSDQAAYRIAVVESQIEPLQMFHELLAQIEHGELTGVLHQVRLGEFGHEYPGQNRQV